MGWLYEYGTEYYRTEKDYAKSIVERNNSRESWFKIDDYAVNGNHLWAIVNRYNEQGELIDKFILLYLLGRYDGAWGYKDIDVYSGPSYWDCPKRIVEACPYDPKFEADREEDRKWGKHWYEGVEKYRQQTNEKARRKRVTKNRYEYLRLHNQIKFIKDLTEYDKVEKRLLQLRNYFEKHNIELPC